MMESRQGNLGLLCKENYKTCIQAILQLDVYTTYQVIAIVSSTSDRTLFIYIKKVTIKPVSQLAAAHGFNKME